MAVHEIAQPLVMGREEIGIGLTHASRTGIENTRMPAVTDGVACWWRRGQFQNIENLDSNQVGVTTQSGKVVAALLIDAIEVAEKKDEAAGAADPV